MPRNQWHSYLEVWSRLLLAKSIQVGLHNLLWYFSNPRSCANGQLVQGGTTPSDTASSAIASSTSSAATCSATAQTFQLSSPPYDNYFYADCHSSSQVVIISPRSDSNLSVISPRLLVAWPVVIAVLSLILLQRTAKMELWDCPWQIPPLGNL